MGGHHPPHDPAADRRKGAVLKATLVPKYYSITATPDEMARLEVIVDMYCRTYETDELDESILATIRGARGTEAPEGEPDGGVPAAV